MSKQVTLSRHAQVRMQQRGIPELMATLLALSLWTLIRERWSPRSAAPSLLPKRPPISRRFRQMKWPPVDELRHSEAGRFTVDRKATQAPQSTIRHPSRPARRPHHLKPDR